MTITVEKISFVLEQLEKRSKNKSEYAENILAFFGLGQEHRFSIFAYVHKEMDLPGYIEAHMERDTKLDDSKPLECWVNFYQNGRCYRAYNSFEEAIEAANENVIKCGVYMREVIPQDEQDKKDAQRYQAAKIARIRHSRLWERMLETSTDKWDKLIDEILDLK